ncbi:MAG TPA: asparagine synthetase B, partial [Patescibacteria group bacterium]|nr:asparagine synthetase B [Patescibacteria group bacterium]
MQRFVQQLFVVFLVACSTASAQKLLIPMDMTQTDHLKSYGIAYWVLSKGGTVDWLLNYRGGSFMMDYSSEIAAECRIRGVMFENVDGGTASQIYAEVQSEGNNKDVQKLEKLPRIAVYVPPGFQPWDDAVTLAMEYAEIKYDKIWDEEVLDEKLKEYDWLHLHHEDFTGQYGKFIAGGFGNAPWYIQQVALLESTAKKLGFKKVTDLKKAVAEKIRTFVSDGGFMFAMCSATDTYDISLAAHNVDFVEALFDGDGADHNANSKLDYSRTFAFHEFKLEMNPYVYEYSNIDVGPTGLENPATDYFTLFDFSAKFDPVPTMLTQCHVNVVKGFLGQTTAFHKNITKKSVTILAEKEGTD